MAIGGGSGYNIALLVRAQNDASKTLKQVQRDLEQVKKDGKEAGKGISQSFGGAESAVKKVAMAVAGLGIASKMISGIKASVRLAGNLEQATVAFETMLGSADKAQKMLSDLSDFAMATPFELTGIRQNAKQLLAMGVEANDLLPTLKSLGDVSAGLSVPLQRLALNYGQVIAQGKLTGRELRDFTVAGVPLADQLATQLGKSTSEIQDMISNGEIASDVVVKAFEDMSSEGGKFFDLMKKQSKTFQGTVSNAQDALDQLGERFGAPLLDPLKGFVNEFITGIEAIDQRTIDTVSSMVVGFLTTFNNVLKGMGSFVSGVASGLSHIYDSVYTAFNGINENNNETVSAITGTWTDLVYFFELGINAISSIIRIGFTFIGETISNIGKQAVNVAEGLLSAWEDVGRGIQAIFKGDFGEVKKIWSERGRGFDDFFMELDFGKSQSAIDGLYEGIEEVHMRYVKSNLESKDLLTDHSKSIQKNIEKSKELEEVKGLLNDATKKGTKSTKEATEAEKNLRAEIQERVGAYVDKTEELRDSIEDQADDLRDLRQEYKDLSNEAVNALDKIDNKMSSRRGEGERSLADRAIEIEEEIKKVQEEYQNLRQDEGFSGENATEKRRELNELRKELEFALANTSEQALAGAREWNEMNEAERIKRKMETDLKELEAEREKLAKEYEMKLENNKKEQQLVTANLEMTMTKYKEHLDTLRGQFTAYYGMIESDTRGHIVSLTGEYDMLIEKLRQVQRMQQDTGTIGINTDINNVTPNQQTGGGGVVNNNSISFGDISINSENMKEEDIRNIMQDIVVDRVQNLSYN